MAERGSLVQAKLTVDDLGVVLEELYGALTHWYKIGLKLGIKVDTLDAIKKSCPGDPSECFQEMLKGYLKKITPSPSWSSLIEALRSCTVDQPHLAETVEQKYCPALKLPETKCTSPLPRKHDENAQEGSMPLSSSEREAKSESPIENELHSLAMQISTSTSSAVSTDKEQQPKDFGCGCGECSFHSFLEKGCPKPILSMSSFSYLNTEGLSESQMNNLIGTLYHEFEVITTDFGSLVHSTCKSLIQQGVTVQKLVVILKTLNAFQPTHVQPSRPLLEERMEELKAAGNIDVVFIILADYMSFFSYHIIDYIIHEFGTPNDKERLQNYTTKLDEYSRRSVFECPTYSPMRKDEANLVIKIEGINQEKYTPHHLQAFRSRISKIIKVSKYTLRLCTVEQGCLQLTFQMPHFVKEVIFPLSESQKTALQDEGVTCLTCGDYQFLKETMHSVPGPRMPIQPVLEMAQSSTPKETQQEDSDTHVVTDGITTISRKLSGQLLSQGDTLEGSGSAVKLCSVGSTVLSLQSNSYTNLDTGSSSETTLAHGGIQAASKLTPQDQMCLSTSSRQSQSVETLDSSKSVDSSRRSSRSESSGDTGYETSVENDKRISRQFTTMAAEKHIPGSPFRLKPQDRLFRTFEHADFTVQSEGKLPLEVLQMTAIYGDIQIPISFKSIVDHVGIASFTPTLPGVYRVEVACIDKLVEGCPFRVKVVDPSRCKILGSIPKYLQYGVSYDFRVTTGEAGVGSLELECAEQQTDTIFVVERRVEKEVQIVSVTPRKEGQFLIGLKFHETHIPSSPFRVIVCDPRGCSVTGDLMERKPGLVGKPLRFRISVRQSASALEIKPVVKAIGPSAKYSAEIRTTDDRTYNVQFTPWEIGTHEISITYGGFHIPKSPFLVAIMGFDTDICSATGTGLQEALTGVPSQFVVIAKQSGLLDDGTLAIKVNGVINQEECKVRARDNKNGSYNVAYMTKIPGAYLVTIMAAGKHIPGSPFRLTAQLGPEAEKCSMFGPALEPNAVLTIGKPIDFSVDTSDAGSGHLTVKAVGPGGAQARVFIARSSKRGVNDIKLDPVRHGKYRVSIKWSGAHIPGSPFLLKIFPGADASKCKAYGPGLEDGLVGKASTFTIETRDAGAGTLKVRLHGVKDAFKIEIKPIDQSDVRTLSARYVPRKPGEYLVMIKWADQNVPGSPFRVKIAGEALEDAFTPPAQSHSWGQRKKASKTIHAESPTKEGSATSTSSGKMVTFSGLQQVQNARSCSEAEKGLVKGEYHGQATVTQRASTKRK